MSCMTIFFHKQVQISRSDIRPHIKWAVSLVILHMVTSIFLQGLCGYIWVNILTLSPRRGPEKLFLQLQHPLYLSRKKLKCHLPCHSQMDTRPIMTTKTFRRQSLQQDIPHLLRTHQQPLLQFKTCLSKIHRLVPCKQLTNTSLPPNALHLLRLVAAVVYADPANSYL